MQYVRPFRGVVLSVLFGVALLFVGCDSGGVNGGNQPPTVDIAVSSSTVDVGTQVVLDGSGSSDPDGGTLSYSWSLNTPSGSQASLSDASVAQPTFTPDVAGDYTATLEVSDGDATRSASTTITAESAQASTTELSGTISSDSTLTADRNYLVTGPLTVADGAMLTIEPGVHLPFESGAGLYINSNSVLDADGTSSEPITMTATNGNKQAGWWEGVFIFSAEPNNLLNYVEIRHTGSGSPNSIGEEAGVAVAGGSALSVTNTTIAESDAYGLYLNEADATLDAFSNNTFSGNADAPVYIPFTNIGLIDSGSSFPDGTTVRVWGTTITGDKDVTVNALSDNTPYRFTDGTSSIGVATGGNSTVTINPGVEMRFAADVGLHVNDGSVLSAAGTAEDPITMAATTGNAQQGWWQGVFVFSGNANNRLDHVEVRHAGSSSPNSTGDGGVVIAGGSALSVTSTTITESGAYGLLMNEADATLDAFSNNTFSGNADAPVYIFFNDIGMIDNGSSFPDDSTVRVRGMTISGDRDMTVNALSGDTPYRFTDATPAIGDPTGGSSTVTINPGVEMRFAADVGLYINNGSVLSAAGTAGDPITMTATAGNAQQGWWEGIYVFSDNPNSRLEYVEVRHAGGGSPNSVPEAANIGVSTYSTIEVSNSTIKDSGNHGVFCDSPSSLTGSGNTYQNNAGQDVAGCQ